MSSRWKMEASSNGRPERGEQGQCGENVGPAPSLSDIALEGLAGHRHPSALRPRIHFSKSAILAVTDSWSIA